jgi:hypothetical protein
MSDVHRQQINALSTISWRTTDIERLRGSLDRQLSRPSGYSQGEVQRMRNEIESMEQTRAVAVRFLAQTGIKDLALSWTPAPLEFLDEVSRTWPLPLPELLDRARKGHVYNPYLALAVAASVANTLSENYPDGSETAGALVDFAEDVGEKFRSIKTHH